MSIITFWSGRVSRGEYIVGAMGVYGFWLTAGTMAAHLGGYLHREGLVAAAFIVVSLGFAAFASQLTARRARDAGWPTAILLGVIGLGVAPLLLALTGVRGIEMAAIWGIAPIVAIAFALCFPKSV